MTNDFQNLHSHTFLSDGKMTHPETLDVAAGNGCGVVAFTDHDTLMPVETFHTLKSVGHTTKFVSGIELSATLDKTSEADTGLHIIGLFVDPTNQSLLSHCQKMHEARLVKARETVANLSKLGFSITIEDCLVKVTDGAVTKPHIVDALVSKTENLTLLRSYIDRLKKAAQNDAGLAADLAEAKEKSINLGIGQYVYPLFLRKDGFVKGAYSDYDATPSLEEAVSFIRSAGGVSLIAHWHHAQNILPLPQLEQLLISKRLDGAETSLGFSNQEESVHTLRRQYDELAHIIDGLGALSSVSLDAHMAGEYSLYKRDHAFAEGSRGRVEKIIDRSGVSTKWSSLGS